jgi:hypothetical protein
VVAREGVLAAGSAVAVATRTRNPTNDQRGALCAPFYLCVIPLGRIIRRICPAALNI